MARKPQRFDCIGNADGCKKDKRKGDLKRQKENQKKNGPTGQTYRVWEMLVFKMATNLLGRGHCHGSRHGGSVSWLMLAD